MWQDTVGSMHNEIVLDKCNTISPVHIHVQYVYHNTVHVIYHIIRTMVSNQYCKGGFDHMHMNLNSQMEYYIDVIASVVLVCNYIWVIPCQITQ